MTAPVEARSLSSLTTLFANPPQYPRNPTHKVLEPLVLYIVRVPGSRDIFLSPLKPPTKASISAEAIQSSLYYFHVPTPEDEVVKNSLEEPHRTWSTEPGSRAEAIQRKPLPSSQFSEPPENEKVPINHSGLPTLVAQLDEDRQAGWQVENVRPVPLKAQDGSTNIARKPVGPRSFDSRSKTSDSWVMERKPVGGSESGGSARHRARQDHLSQVENSVPNEGGQLTNSVGDVEGNWALNREPRTPAKLSSGHSQPPPPPPLPSRPSYPSFEHPTVEDFCINIIRRDPTSGSQWNIGSLSREHSSAGLMEVDSLRIEITAPGYQKFARQPDHQTPNRHAFEQTKGEPPGDGSPGHRSSTAEHYASATNTSKRSSTHFQPTLFTRHITLTRPSSSHRPKSSSHHHKRSTSSDSFPFSPPSQSSSTSPTVVPPYLTFTSPWHGTCAFTTGMDGRTLKLRHQLPSSNAESGDNNSGPVITELRFNHPWSALKSRDTNAFAAPLAGGGGGGGVVAGVSGRRPKSLAVLGEDAKHSLLRSMAKIRRELHSTSSDRDICHSNSNVPPPPAAAAAAAATAVHQPFIPPLSSSSSSFTRQDDFESSSSASSASSTPRLDLSLGRERAGGGRKGKSAKLGKLVLRDEGLKMADLVVSASVGVWWDVYWGVGGGGGGER